MKFKTEPYDNSDEIIQTKNNFITNNNNNYNISSNDRFL